MAAMNIRLVLVLQENGSFIINEYQNKKFRDLPGISEDTFGICFTSGSTSRPKGIVLSNSAITGNALAVAKHLGFSSEERTIIPRSLAQASPISGDVLMAISRGGGIMLPQILEYSQLKNYDLSSVRRILIEGMVNPSTIYQRTAAAFPGLRVFNAYGTSEAFARVTFGEHEDVISLPCVIGKPMKGCGIKIYREDGTEAAVGETGELYITSDYMMDGYYESAELTGEVLGSKGFRVRDLGSQNPVD